MLSSAALWTITFLVLEDTLWAISAQYFLHQEKSNKLFQTNSENFATQFFKHVSCHYSSTCCASTTTLAPWGCEQGTCRIRWGGCCGFSCQSLQNNTRSNQTLQISPTRNTAAEFSSNTQHSHEQQSDYEAGQLTVTNSGLRDGALKSSANTRVNTLLLAPR
jgi:hypothetical protein